MSATTQAAEAETGAAGRQFVTFNVRDELFGVPLSEVQEIIRMPELVQVPLCAPSLEGIANLRGVVLPVTSLRRVFGTDDAEHDDATRVVVVNRAGAPVGFVVDRMASVITAEASEIEGTETMQGTLHSDLLSGVVKRATGLIMLLDPGRLVATDLRSEGRVGNGRGLGTAGMAVERNERGQTSTVDDMQLVSFEAAGQEYAFPIEEVQEIVQVPGTITQVPQAQPQVVGVMTLRERLLPLVSLRRMFALPGATVDEHSRIVVVSAGGPGSPSVGIVMDKVKEVLRVNRSLIDPVPAMLAGGEGCGQNAFEAICRLNGGKRLVTILSAHRMFRDAALRGALATATGKDSRQEVSVAEETDRMPGSRGAAGTFDEEQFVVFRLAGEEYGVPIDSVQEIVRVPNELTHVPKAASFMEGVVNLRGTVLPVVDQRRRFALAEAERNDRQRIMVLTIAGTRTGFIVDQVSEVLKISRASIEPAPELSEEQARLIRRVANLEAQKRMILLLDPANLLAAGEVAAIGAM
jgi:purine-binding chemotaxis protein CheW